MKLYSDCYTVQLLWLRWNKDGPGLDLKALILSAMLSLLPGLRRTRSLRAAVMSVWLKDITCSTCLTRGSRWDNSCSSVLPTLIWAPMRSRAVRRWPIYTSTSCRGTKVQVGVGYCIISGLSRVTHWYIILFVSRADGIVFRLLCVLKLNIVKHWEFEPQAAVKMTLGSHTQPKNHMDSHWACAGTDLPLKEEQQIYKLQKLPLVISPR